MRTKEEKEKNYRWNRKNNKEISIQYELSEKYKREILYQDKYIIDSRSAYRDYLDTLFMTINTYLLL